MDPIIDSLLANDFYKFTMQQLVWGRFSDVNVEYKLYNRGNTSFPKGFANKLRKQVDAMGELKLKPQELEFLGKNAPFFKTSYLEWLERFQPDPRQVVITQRGEKLDVRIAGPWHQTMYWEVPLMATISELYFVETNQPPSSDYLQQATQKFAMLKEAGVSFADFGLRRRYSGAVHEAVLLEMMKHSKGPNDLGGFVGTSMVKFAYNHDLRKIGTKAHELPMVFACIYGFQSANEKMLELWQDEFNGDLGTALTDTFTTPVFLRSFSKKYANAFDSVRQDSGSPEQYVDLIVAHYEKLGIDPMSKTIIFSDGLNAQRAIEIAQYCRGKIKCSFGIGTNFTNDVGVKPLNIVIKAYRAGRAGWPMLPTVKLSDAEGKITGDKKTAEAAKYFLGI